MSAKNEYEKVTRIKDFFKGQSGQKIHLWGWLKTIKGYTLNLITYCSDDHKLRLIDKHYGYLIEPYLRDASASNNVIDGNLNGFQTNEGTITEIEVECMMEKHFLYDTIMKSLHVWTILHAGLLRHQQFHQSKALSLEIKEIFTCELGIPIIHILRKALKYPSCRGKSWILETFLKNCPFMFQMHDKHNMLEALTKMIKGEEISEVAEERLFFFIEGLHFEEAIFLPEEFTDDE